MAKQLLIIGLTGPHDPDLAKKITELLCVQGFSVRHASLRYGGTTTFHTGGTADLTSELAEAGVTIKLVGGTAPAAAAAPVDEGAVTLATVNKKLNLLLERGLEVVTLDGEKVPVAAGLGSVFEQLDRIEAGLGGKKKGAPKAPKPPVEKKAGPEPQNGNPANEPPVVVPPDVVVDEGKSVPVPRDIDGNGCCTVCGQMFEEEVDMDNHINGPMCQPAQPPSEPPPGVVEETSDDDDQPAETAA